MKEIEDEKIFNNKVLHAINMVRNTQVILDPFPEDTLHEKLYNFSPKMFKKWFGKKIEPSVSIHEAYFMGYDKAYSEMKAELTKFLY
jgi:hypothetical protein